jgi:amino acid adenylation domain-containing protein
VFQSLYIFNLVLACSTKIRAPDFFLASSINWNFLKTTQPKKLINSKTLVTMVGPEIIMQSLGEEQSLEQQRQLKYWSAQLQGSHLATFLCDKPRPDVLSGKAGSHEIKITDTLYNDLQRYCQTKGVTPFVVLFAAFRAAHYRLSGTEDATIGTAMSNRNRVELEDLVGFFVNLQCIRTKIEEESFEQLLDQVRKVTAAAHENQDVPFERVVTETVGSNRDMSRNPLVQVIFVFHSQTNVDQLELEGVRVEQIPSTPTSRFDLEFHLFQGDGCLYGHVLYAAQLYDPRTISNVAAIFRSVLHRGLCEPHTPIPSLVLDDAIGALRDLDLLEIARTDYPRESSVIDVFRSQVAAFPDIVAVKDPTTRLTYAQLDGMSDKISSWLTLRALSPETLVAVLATRSCQTIAALLGILKAGLAYLPLDLNAPGARIGTILSSVSGHKLVLLGASVSAPDLQIVDVEYVAITETMHAPLHDHCDLDDRLPLPILPTATSLAYVMFTSGSTGKPKGVMIEHRGIVKLAKDKNILAAEQVPTSIAHLTNISFDVSTWEIYTVLLNGGTLVCIDHITLLDGPSLMESLTQEAVSVAIFTPALLARSLAECPLMFTQLQTVLVAGDRLDPQHARDLSKLVNGRVLNAYGPTESTVLGTIYRLLPEENFINGVPIGRAISDTGAYVMGDQQHLVSPGVLGELVLTGDGLARGYTDPELDVGRFVHANIDGQTVRCYRTGDLARFRLTDGQLEFFGRMDHQIKIRGYRVELSEIERLLTGCEGVGDAVTVVRRREETDPEIVSFVTSRGTLSDTNLIKSLYAEVRAKLPSYMIPTAIEILPTIPINGSGKADRRTITDLASNVRANGVSLVRTLPRNDTERAVCEEFADILGVEVGIHDNFFDIGGHSLLVTRLVSRVCKRTTCEISLLDFMNSPTPVTLSQFIDSIRSRRGSTKGVWYQEVHSRPNSRATLVLIHGIWGQGSVFSPMVSSLSPTAEILIIYDPFLGQSDHPKTISKWAEFYLDDICDQVAPDSKVIFGGYSLGGLLAFEMTLLWHKRCGTDPAALLLLDPATYSTKTLYAHDTHGKKEISHALEIFGKDQESFVKNHFQKIAPMLRSSEISARYSGRCIYVGTKESAATGRTAWWKSRCPHLQLQVLDCSHHDLMDPSRSNILSALINDHCLDDI